MEYQRFLDEVQSFDFVPHQDAADAIVKGTLGILASRLDEPAARKMTENLPGPLTLEKLRSHQRYPLDIPVDQYIENIGGQFRLTREQAHQVARRILHLAKEAMDPKSVQEIEKHLPADWVSVIEIS